MALRRPLQPGFSMLLVLILIAAASLLGLSYLAGASVRASCADNLLKVGRAQYLAESALDHAMYLLETNPEALEGTDRTPLGPFSLDATDDFYTMQAVPNGDRPGTYTLLGHGTAGGVTQTVSALLLVVDPGVGGDNPVDNCVTLGAAGGLTLMPQSVTINGDLHLNASLLNLAEINGNVRSAGNVLDWWRRIRGEISEDVEPLDVPHLEAADLESYEAPGIAGAAVQRDRVKDMKRDDPLAKGGAITEDNPAGVVVLTPKDPNKGVRLKDHLNFRGTLVIRGDAVIDGKDIDLTAVEGFPALVVEGHLTIRRSASMTVNGLVYTSGRVTGSGDTSRSRTTINGGLVTESDGFSLLLKGQHTLNYDRERCSIYAFEGGGEGGLEILRYDD